MSAHKITDRELATILAALRLWQTDDIQHHLPRPFKDIATNDGYFIPLDEDEIDELCERLNLGDKHDAD